MRKSIKIGIGALALGALAGVGNYSVSSEPAIHDLYELKLLNATSQYLQIDKEIGTLQEDYAPDEIVMRFQPGVSKADQDKLLQTYSLNEIKEIPGINVKVLKVLPEDLDAKIEALLNDPYVEFAEKNYIVQALDISRN